MDAKTKATLATQVKMNETKENLFRKGQRLKEKVTETK
jgi:hypothetical protein